ncbi:methyltransferase domain-containing protein [Acidisphaera rubrifaciens]|uniref:Type 12 methyltransferase n=1 Tax=Acidisphaera rubrifaciens HS-AP3 TaxID=1231350 RepID=A0A0D6P7R0_9PROT|nr:methyltransferase domain-containing protein [Acidisphaera rubrifaciens]GAN77238.1 type 12 methyltransferase [Acidisphaera rubrifaciens HS-AP3]
MRATHPPELSARARFLLGDIDLAAARGLEIGALNRPVIPPSLAAVTYVDHAPTEALREKYRGDPNVDIDRIVSVDAVWGEQSLAECLAGRAPFNYAIAAHVIEHVPDLVGWLHEVAEVLRPGGELMLVVPDKRYTFDLLRQTSRLADVIESYVRGVRRPTPGQVFDHFANLVEVDVAAAWAGTLEPARLRRRNGPHGVLALCRTALDGAYHDSHCWVFTVATFPGLCAALADLDLMPFELVRFQPTPVNDLEMLAVLRRPPEGTPGGLGGSFRAVLDRLEARQLVTRGDGAGPDGATLWDTLVARLDAAAAATAQAEAERDNLASREAALRAELDRQSQQIKALAEELARLKSSRSWRWTRFMRAARGGWGRRRGDGDAPPSQLSSSLSQ